MAGCFSILTGLIGKKKGVGGALVDTKAGYRTEEQEKAVFYFSDKNKKGCIATLKGCFVKKEKKGCGETLKGCFPKKGKGCFPKKHKYVSDADYDEIVANIVKRVDPEARGLERLVLDKSQVEKTIPFSNYAYGPRIKFGEDGKFRSSLYEVTYLFFTQNEIAAYQLTLSSDWEKHDEQTFEYHYKDITALSTETTQKDVLVEDEKGGKKKEYRTVKNTFKITVPNDSFEVSLGNKPTAEEEDAIQGMKALLREKKA
jgi:hypothetical protein